MATAEYFRRRETDCRIMARASQSLVIALIHEDLAQRFANQALALETLAPPVPGGADPIAQELSEDCGARA